MSQLELHKRIGEFFAAGTDCADVFVAQSLQVNEDAKRFFFSLADESWLGWLWQEGFLDEIKNKAEDPMRYSYRMSELEYLTRMAEKNPQKVTEIIASVSISQANFNPEVVDRFLQIINSLPAEQIKTLTAKIRDERWVHLMRDFQKTGYEFEGMIKELVGKNEGDAILELAQAILTVKSKKEIPEKERSFSIENPFYVGDLEESGIFEALINIGEGFKEKALQITTTIIGEIVKLGEPDNGVFVYSDSFSLYDVDFFTLEVESGGGHSFRRSEKNLGATVTKLIKDTIGNKCSDPSGVKKLFGDIDSIPSCRSIWRLRLFALAQCPEVFKDELKETFFKLFAVDNYYEIAGGVEYKKALKIGFSHLSNDDQRAYVAGVLAYFSKRAQQDPDKSFIKRDGWKILSSICDYLSEKERERCEDVFGNKCDATLKLELPKEESRGGAVKHQSPVNLEDYTIKKIIENLKTEWTAEKLNEQFKNDDFLKPRGVEGLGDALKEDIKNRIDEYLKDIRDFFDRESIHSHYVYSLLRGIEEMLRNGKSLNSDEIVTILDFFEAIRISGDNPATPFKREENKSWLVDWVGVHGVITDILLHILEDKESKETVQKTHRAQIFLLISYLFTIKDSPSKEDEKPEYGELYGVAINSVRGRVYEAFVTFTTNDGKTLADDIKELYKKTLSDDSLAVRFMIGRYLASFYFRDKDFIINLLLEIFPKDETVKKDIYLATWEGYLSNTLYDKLFVALRDYYNHAIALDPKNYTDRKYLTGLDESLAVHLALAFVHLGLEMDDPLFEKFWRVSNTVRHKEFISFIGRNCLTRGQAGDEWLKENKVSKEKLLAFWDWALQNDLELEAFSGFGFWINPDREILSDDVLVERIAKTLEKSEGAIDWDNGLMERLTIFAEKNEEKTLEIITRYLLGSNGDLNKNRRTLFMCDAQIKDSLKIIYKNGNDAIKQNVTDLISTLIEKGSNAFWGLKDILED
ncbi:MAG: hypothetical protein WCT24_02515 [Patescibacteria group bacterium]